MFEVFKKFFVKKEKHTCWTNMTKIGAGLWKCNDCETKWELKSCCTSDGEEPIENSELY